METREFVFGSWKVCATRNDAASVWHARLYVNNGETATLTCGKFKSDRGLERWASKQLSRKSQQ